MTTVLHVCTTCRAGQPVTEGEACAGQRLHDRGHLHPGLSRHEVAPHMRERKARMAELADAVSHSRSRVTHTIARLEREGIVLRGNCSDDGRGVSAVLTDHGFSVLEAAAHTHVRGVHDYLIANADADQLAALGQVMDKVLDTLQGRTF